jgi:hypothetical protein
MQQKTIHGLNVFGEKSHDFYPFSRKRVSSLKRRAEGSVPGRRKSSRSALREFVDIGLA